MSTDRRSFLERITLGAMGAGALQFLPGERLAALRLPADGWDFTWTGRLKNQSRAVFDVPEIEQGYGVWRAIGTRRQYQEVLKKPLDMVLVLRHNGIALAMNQAFWEKYNVGTDKKALDPLTNQPTTRNPVVDRTGPNALPEPFSGFALEPFIAGGGIVLGCALAFQECIGRVKEADKVDDAEAEKRAKSMLVPGVILQPSGVFAALLAQESGCRYVRAS
jgi:hypothetical protein